MSLTERVRALPEEEARTAVLDHVLEKAAAVLGHPSGASIDPDEKFWEIGFDSMLSMELSKRLSATTGVRLKANMVLRHPTARLIAGHLVTRMARTAA